MGHRALVAYERADGRYDLHYAHWGGTDLRLVRALTPRTPFGGPDADDEWVRWLRARLAGEDPDSPTGVPTEGDADATVVNPRPRARGLTLEEILAEHLDFLSHEAFYVVHPDFAVDAFLPLWFGMDVDDPTVGNGALVGVRPPGTDGDPDAEYVRAWFQGAKRVVETLVDEGERSRTAATDLLETVLRTWAGDDRPVEVVRQRGGA